jgi:uracil-DNA glycosylase
MNRCPLCPGINNCVAGDGPDSDYYCLLEAPGPTEDKRGIPLCGKTGDETNRHYFPIAGLKRPNVRVDNAISCLPPGPDGKLDPKRRKDLDLLQSCAEHHVYPYLERVRPRLIIPMGSFACRAIDPEIDLELQHGMPISTQWGTAFPMYHPAGGIHEPKKMLLIRTDWTRLRKYIIGRLVIPKDAHEGSTQYQEVTSCSHLDGILKCKHYSVMACDTEVKRGGDPYCLTFSIQQGEGYLIKSSRLDILETYQSYLSQWGAPILFHNWLFDGQVVKTMGLVFPNRLIRDTMVKVFSLGNLPQGLKALSYRELGMKMQDFNDLVTPYAKPLVLDYFRAGMLEEWPKPQAEMVRDKDGRWKLYQPQAFGTKLKRFFTDYAKNEDKDPFDAWSNWDTCHQMVESELGPYPGKCITQVPFEKVLYYACLSKDSRVETPEGYRSIGSLVKTKYHGKVLSFDPIEGRLIPRRVVGHYRIRHEEPIQWLSIENQYSTRGRWGTSATRYTPDHRLLTPQGYKSIESLSGDIILLPIQEITPQEWQIVFGSLLGDGGITQKNQGGWASLRFSHNERQKDYLDWKVSLLTTLRSNISEYPATTKIIDGREANCKIHYEATSIVHPQLVEIREKSYMLSGKEIGVWVKFINPLALAVWYQDDGTLVGGEYARLYTLGFYKSDVDWLIAILSTRFGIYATSYETGREGQWAIQIPADYCDRFFGLIFSYVHPTMQYKLPLKWRGRHQPLWPTPEYSTRLVKSRVKSVYSNPVPKSRRGSTYYSYCIDVEDTHNFATIGEIAHNCRDADATLRLWSVLKQMNRRVRRAPQENWRDAA